MLFHETCALAPSVGSVPCHASTTLSVLRYVYASLVSSFCVTINVAALNFPVHVFWWT